MRIITGIAKGAKLDSPLGYSPRRDSICYEGLPSMARNAAFATRSRPPMARNAASATRSRPPMARNAASAMKDHPPWQEMR